MPESTIPVVYVNDVQFGPLDALYNMHVNDVMHVSYLSPADATTRFGTGHAGGRDSGGPDALTDGAARADLRVPLHRVRSWVRALRAEELPGAELPVVRQPGGREAVVAHVREL